MNQFHGISYMSLVPLDTAIPVTKVYVNYDAEANPDGMEHRRSMYGMPKILCNRMPAHIASTYIVAGIHGTVGTRGIQVVVADIDALGSVTIEYTINGLDWTTLPTPIFQNIPAGAGRQTYLWSFADLACLQFRVGWAPGGGAAAGTIEVYAI